MLRRAILALVLAAIPAAAQPTCESLTRLSLPGVVFKSAANVPAVRIAEVERDPRVGLLGLHFT